MTPELSSTIPTIFVIFGATGDLVGKKIVPALWHLFLKGKLPDAFQVIGAARRELSDEAFRTFILEIVDRHADHASDHSTRMSFVNSFSYHRSNFEDEQAYRALAQRLQKIEETSQGAANVLVYLAVPPEAYDPIFERLAHSGLMEQRKTGNGWTRLIVEKPIGQDTQSAERLDERIGSLFPEESVYRIDHYLAKEMVQNILCFRFTNNLFEQSWNANFIESIHIRLWETLGVEARGAFYDGLGTLRDVGQNHLLQMLAFATMDHPQTFEAEVIRQKRTEVLQTLKSLSTEEIRQTSRRAQYEGYRTIAGVSPDSQTETYFWVQAFLDAPRWKGVPITMESGKRMVEARKELIVTFKHPMPCLCPPGATHHLKNQVIFSLEPEERISIRLWTKSPGLEFAVEEKTLELTLRDNAPRSQYVEEYEKLLLDCINGDQTLFVSTDEVRAMWRYIDPIVAAWKENLVPLASYPPDAQPLFIV